MLYRYEKLELLNVRVIFLNFKALVHQFLQLRNQF